MHTHCVHLKIATFGSIFGRIFYYLHKFCKLCPRARAYATVYIYTTWNDQNDFGISSRFALICVAAAHRSSQKTLSLSKQSRALFSPSLTRRWHLSLTNFMFASVRLVFISSNCWCCVKMQSACREYYENAFISISICDANKLLRSGHPEPPGYCAKETRIHPPPSRLVRFMDQRNNIQM